VEDEGMGVPLTMGSSPSRISREGLDKNKRKRGKMEEAPVLNVSSKIKDSVSGATKGENSSTEDGKKDGAVKKSLDAGKQTGVKSTEDSTRNSKEASSKKVTSAVKPVKKDQEKRSGDAINKNKPGESSKNVRKGQLGNGLEKDLVVKQTAMKLNVEIKSDLCNAKNSPDGKDVELKKERLVIKEKSSNVVKKVKAGKGVTVDKLAKKSQEKLSLGKQRNKKQKV